MTQGIIASPIIRMASEVFIRFCTTEFRFAIVNSLLNTIATITTAGNDPHQKCIESKNGHIWNCAASAVKIKKLSLNKFLPLAQEFFIAR